MFDLSTIIWICIGISYSALFIVDAKVISKKKRTQEAIQLHPTPKKVITK